MSENKKRPYRLAVITASDKGYTGQRVDESGPLICQMAKKHGYDVVHAIILPDDLALLAAEMKRICDDNVADLLLTTGGTGFAPRDCMPEATQQIVEKLVPGIPEAMRAYSLTITNRAMLSRAVAGIRKKTLIVNLPGSPKSVKENLTAIIDALKHGLDILTQADAECARFF